MKIGFLHAMLMAGVPALEPSIELVASDSATGTPSSITLSSLALTPGRYVALFGGARSTSGERTFVSMTHSAIDSQSAVGSHFEDGTTNDGYAFAREFTVVTGGTDDFVVTLSDSLFALHLAIYRITDLGTISLVETGGDEGAGFASFDVTGSPGGSVAMGLAAGFVRNSVSDKDLLTTWGDDPADMSTAGAYSGIAGATDSPGGTITFSREDAGYNILSGAAIALWFDSL